MPAQHSPLHLEGMVVPHKASSDHASLECDPDERSAFPSSPPCGLLPWWQLRSVPGVLHSQCQLLLQLHYARPWTPLPTGSGTPHLPLKRLCQHVLAHTIATGAAAAFC